MKKFVINCDFSGQQSPFYIYIGLAETDHHPAHFQADWLSKQRGGSIPSSVMDALGELKTLAQKNNVLLEDLCVYALGSSSTLEEEVSEINNQGGESTSHDEQEQD